jgi:hypothetical protein
VVVQKPFKNDKDKGFLFSSSMGYVWHKMMVDAGIPDYYAISAQPDLDHLESYANVSGMLNQYKPPFIIMIEEAGLGYCPELTPKYKGKDYDPETDTDISKYCGSLLTSSNLRYPHYIIPTYSAATVIRQWQERDITISCDLSRVKAELDYWRQYGILQPLPDRKCKIDFDSFDELLWNISNMSSTSRIISNDIETVYPRDKSVWKGLHPGYPITIGLASSSGFGISFNLFRDSVVETRKLWRTMDALFSETIQLGQNFLVGFDLNFYEMLGFNIKPEHCIDTMIRQHTLFPELPKTLQFMTRQYTRQPYYKDEGHGWSIKDMQGLKHYNCLDVCCTFEIYEAQEKIFNERPELR